MALMMALPAKHCLLCNNQVNTGGISTNKRHLEIVPSSLQLSSREGLCICSGDGKSRNVQDLQAQKEPYGFCSMGSHGGGTTNASQCDYEKHTQYLVVAGLKHGS